MATMLNRPKPKTKPSIKIRRRKICPDGSSVPEGFPCPQKMKKPPTPRIPKHSSQIYRGTKAQEFKNRYGK